MCFKNDYICIIASTDVEADVLLSGYWLMYLCAVGTFGCGPEELPQQLHQGEYSARVQCTGRSLSGLWGAQVNNAGGGLLLASLQGEKEIKFCVGI